MKNILLFALAIFSVQFSTLQNCFAQQQRITVYKNGTHKATFNNIETTVKDFNNGCEIFIALHPSLDGATIIIVHKDETPLATEQFQPQGDDGLFWVINPGKEKKPYTITVSLEGDSKSIIINDVGTQPTIQCGSGGSNSHSGNTQCTPPDAGCDCKKVDSDNILQAMQDCYECGLPEYVYDARCKKLYVKEGNKYNKAKEHKLKFKYNKTFRVGIVHANRYLKDVKVSATNQIFESKASPLFLNFFGGTGETKLLEIINAAHGGGMSKAIPDGFTKTNGTAYTDLKKEIGKFATTIMEMLEAQQKVYYECCEATDVCSTATKKYSIYGLKDDLKKINSKYEKLTKPLKENIAQRKKSEDEIKRLNGLLEKNDANKQKIKQDINTQKQQIATLKVAEPEAGKRLIAYETLLKGFKQPTEEQIRDLVLFNRNYLKSHYSFFTSDFQPKGNWVNVAINIDSRDTHFVYRNGISPADHQEKLFDGPVVGNWLFSFSSGPFFGGGNNVYEKEYEFRKTPSFGNVVNDTSMYSLTESGYTNPPVGLSALAHFQYRCRGISPGVSIGVGLTAEEKPKVAYLLGPSLFLGNKHQFAITAGIMGMQVNVLRKDLYPAYLSYETPPDLQYEKQLRQGWFMSVSYTLFTTKDDK